MLAGLGERDQGLTSAAGIGIPEESPVAPQTVLLAIDGRTVEAPAGASILEAALAAGIYIPQLCHHPDLPPEGTCRLCVVEIEGTERPVASCETEVAAGMVVRTQSEEIDRRRRLAMELLLVAHPPECGSCEKYLNCELQSLKQYLGVEELSIPRRVKLLPVDDSNPLFVFDPNKCVLCDRCVRACWVLRGARVLHYRRRGGEFYIYTDGDVPLAQAGCRFCGACAEVCPTGAIRDKAGIFAGAERRAVLVPCKGTCPAEIDVPRYVRLIKQGDYPAAAAVIREKAPFPGVLGYVCDHPCEANCRRGAINEPIAIRELKRLAAEHDDGSVWKERAIPKDSTGKRVAVVGAGPAGLTAAYHLCLHGHQVTVFEALPEPGGMLRYGIPDYRLPRAVLTREVAEVLAAGVTLKTATPVESVEELLTAGYDGVVVAVGAQEGQRLRLPGASAAGGFTGVDFLRQVNSGVKVGVADSVVVIGGGNVAFDCARMARRLGATQVWVACLECREEMPAAPEEIEEGEAEGVVILPSLVPSRLQADKGRVAGVELLEVAAFCFDEEGRAEVETVEGSGRLIPAGTVIFATGQRPAWPEGFGLEVTERGLAVADPRSQATSREGVFAAGDAVTGTASVIKAIASGKKAAAALDRYLGGSGRLDRRLGPAAEADPCFGPALGFAELRRIEGRLDKGTGVGEAARCLQCDSRLQIKAVEFWGDY